ncbi:MAG: site-specific DNA-methyltransferase [Solirubrobacteraceae bacterium]|jgi:site-specific DNA-methyltransferase (adenine-specific)
MTRKLTVYSDATNEWGLIEGDAFKVLAGLPDACISTIVTDPPYGIAFHDEAWDGTDIHRAVSARGERLSRGEAFERWTRVWAAECLRVLRPGGHLLAFSAPRMSHRLTSAVEDAGFEIRDQLLWLNAQGIPKSRRLPGGRATTLKPCFEPIVIARSPMIGGTDDNLVVHGTGALNIEANRVKGYDGRSRWPANIVLSHAEDCTDSGCSDDCPVGMLDPTLSRLFFCAKATRAEREAGCEALEARLAQVYTGKHHPPRLVHNGHPCVKPLALMRWLVRLVTPPDAVVLDPFAGSGSTGAAAVLEGRRFLGIERESQYVDIACARLTHWANKTEVRS